MATTQPNILLIMADQLIPTMTGAYGNGVACTPNIDRLAARSTVFDAAYSPCPICAPARMGLMTGRHVSDINCNDNTSILASDEPTMCHYLSAAGYDTVLSGKMHFVGPDQLHGYGRRLTTDVYPSDFTWLNSREKGRTHAAIHDNPIAIDYVTKGVGVRQWSMQLDYDEETPFRALEYLRTKRSRPSGTLQKPLPPRDDTPFFLTVSYQHPHEPFHCLQRHWDLYEGVEIPIPQYPEGMDEQYTSFDRMLNTWHGCDQVDLRNPDSLRNLHRAYLASVSYFDEKLGELLTSLEELGLSDDTIVLLASDHGDMLGHRGMVQKRCFYEQSSRIPLMVSFPGNAPLAPNGSRVAAPVSLLDIFPTVLECAGIDAWMPVDGRSLLGSCRGDIDDTRAVVVENHSEATTTPCFMVRRGQWKYTCIHGAEEQLFDIDHDPGEWDNRIDDPACAAVREELKAVIMDRFDPDRIDRELNENLARRAVVKSGMLANGGPKWDYQPFFDETKRYWREG